MLEGKVAVITGGATGIGAATASLFAQKGAQVVITSEQSAEQMQPAVDQITAAGGAACAITCDITDRQAIARLIAEVDTRFGRIDCLVNCAGVCFWGPLEEMSAEKIDLMFGVNAIGPISMIQAALPVMRRTGGAIVNISSGSAVLGVPQFPVYAASKAAIAHFTRTFAPELRRSNIRVNAIAPGSVRTRMLGFESAELTEEQKVGMAKREERSVSPYGNPLIEPSDIAEVALYLCSDQARAMHGSLVVADQGITSAMPAPAG